MAGHAILNSGIMEASKTQLAVSQIKELSDELVLNNSSVSSVSGAIKTNELDIQAGNDYSAVVDLSSSSNQISQLYPSYNQSSYIRHQKKCIPLLHIICLLRLRIFPQI